MSTHGILFKNPIVIWFLFRIKEGTFSNEDPDKKRLIKKQIRLILQNKRKQQLRIIIKIEKLGKIES